MEKAYFRIIFSIYFTALVVCGVLRVAFKLAFIDTQTGFYLNSAGRLPLVFNIVLGTAALLMLIINVVRKGGHDYPVNRPGKILPVLAILTGAAIFLFMWLGMPAHFGQNAGRNATWELVITFANYLLAGLGGLSMVYSGVNSLAARKTPNPVIMLFPALWQMALLLSRFNGYFSITQISDNLLAVFLMLFSSIFYLGHARTLCGLGRGDGRNYVISTGLAASLCGLLLSIPNFVYMAVCFAPIPALETSLFECLYALSLGVYALIFTLSYAKSIKYV